MLEHSNEFSPVEPEHAEEQQAELSKAFAAPEKPQAASPESQAEWAAQTKAPLSKIEQDAQAFVKHDQTIENVQRQAEETTPEETGTDIPSPTAGQPISQN